MDVVALTPEGYLSVLTHQLSIVRPLVRKHLSKALDDIYRLEGFVQLLHETEIPTFGTLQFGRRFGRMCMPLRTSEGLCKCAWLCVRVYMCVRMSGGAFGLSVCVSCQIMCMSFYLSVCPYACLRLCVSCRSVSRCVCS